VARGIFGQRRLFDQPEYIANLDLTWSEEKWGTSITTAVYRISDVLTTVGLTSFTFDLYEREHTRLDVILNQRLTSRLKLRLTAKNLTDPVRGTIYDRDRQNPLLERNRYKAGREFGLSITAEF
jgi:outer membrane receptor protein involved in Fe transport